MYGNRISWADSRGLRSHVDRIATVLRLGLCLALLLKISGAQQLAEAVKKGTGVIELPAGTTVLTGELRIPDGAHDLELRGHPAGSTLKAAAGFKGRALIVAKGAMNLRLTGFQIDGNRAALDARIGLPPSDVPFSRYYSNNGILIEGARGVTIRNIGFQGVANFPVLVSASSGILIEDVRIEDSGSLNPLGRNNASGGILLEEGTSNFQIRRATIHRVRGNAIWTHSNYHSARNAEGVIADNQIEEIARDAIQVGHATNVRVERNSGRRIGYPMELVDMAGYGVPAALDTAGNVDKSVYAGNHFEDVNGKCIDLDGFHDGEVRDNSCVSRKTYDDYPFAQYGIVFNDTNPDYEPANVTITGNLIDGAGYGGLFIFGATNVVSRNRFLNLNRNHCTGDVSKPRCNYAADQPDLLRSGIYLARGAARPADTRQNQITDNEISGFGMENWCIVAAPGVSLERNQIARNRCTSGPFRQRQLDWSGSRDHLAKSNRHGVLAGLRSRRQHGVDLPPPFGIRFGEEDRGQIVFSEAHRHIGLRAARRQP